MLVSIEPASAADIAALYEKYPATLGINRMIMYDMRKLLNMLVNFVLSIDAPPPPKKEI